MYRTERARRAEPIDVDVGGGGGGGGGGGRRSKPGRRFSGGRERPRAAHDEYEVPGGKAYGHIHPSGSDRSGPLLSTASSEASDRDDGSGGGLGGMPPSQYVLKEIYGLSHATDAKTAHRHLVHLRSLSVHRQRRSEIASAGGIQVIVTALDTYGRESSSVAKQACAAVQNLSMEREGAASVSDHWGVTQVIRVMGVHSHCAGVQEAGCAALRNLTAGSSGNRTEVGRMGGIRAVVSALRRHVDSDRICDKAVAALGNLCLKHQENRRQIGKEAGVAAIVDALRAHPDHEGLAEKGVRTLWDLAHHWQNVDLIRAEEGVTDLILGMGVKYPAKCKKKAIQVFLRL